MESLLSRSVFFGRSEPSRVSPPAPVSSAPLSFAETLEAYREGPGDIEMADRFEDVDPAAAVAEHHLNTVVSLADIEGTHDEPDIIERVTSDLVPVPEADVNIPYIIEPAVPASTARKGRTPSRATSKAPSTAGSRAASAVASASGRSGLASALPEEASSTGSDTDIDDKVAEDQRSSPAKRKAMEQPAAPPAKKRTKAAATRTTSARKAVVETKKQASALGRRKAAPIAKPTKTGKRGRPAKSSSNENDDEAAAGDAYEVEEILDDGVDADTMQHMFLVKWKGYSASDNTWEPKTNLKRCNEIVQAYLNEKKDTEAAENVKSKKNAPPKSAKKASTAGTAKRGRPVGRPVGRPAGRPAGRPVGRPPGRRGRKANSAA